MAATAILAPLQASTGPYHHEEQLHLDLHSATMASKMQTTMERESAADRAARCGAYEESEAEHEQLGAAPNHQA